MTQYILDLESDGLIPQMTKVHSIVLKNIQTNELISCANQEGYHSLDFALDLIGNADLLIGGYLVSGDSNSQPYLKSAKRLSSFEFAFNRRGGCHQAMLFHKKKVLEFGVFDIDFELASDFDLVMKIVKGENSFRAERVFACIEPGGVSDQRIYDVIREKHQIRRSHFERKTLLLLVSIGWGIAVKSKIRARNFLRLLSKRL